VKQATGSGMLRRWRAFMARCAPGSGGEAHFRRLDDLYAQPDRHYHNWDHIARCLEELAPLRSRCRDPLALEMAIWFHDAVYDPRRHDNERESALLARRAGGALGLSPALLDEVEGLILLTDHRRVPAAADARLLLDIDLAVLASGRRRYAAYEAAIRREYDFVAEKDYRLQRSRLLESFLTRPAVYTSPRFRRRYEARARRNLRAALARLGRFPGAPGGLSPGRGPGG
jgi:predicted metal-dependent HD superfamily phosphohydrolase